MVRAREVRRWWSPRRRRPVEIVSLQPRALLSLRRSSPSSSMGAASVRVAVASASGLAGSGAGSGAGGGLGPDMMGVENLSSAASFLSTSARAGRDPGSSPSAACSPCFSASQSSAACASPRTFSRAASMCSCAASGAAAARTARRSGEAQAPGLALSLARAQLHRVADRLELLQLGVVHALGLVLAVLVEPVLRGVEERRRTPPPRARRRARASATLVPAPYTYSSTAFLRSFVSSITRSCSAISNSSLTNCSRTWAGRPPTVEDTGTSIFLTFFFSWEPVRRHPSPWASRHWDPRRGVLAVLGGRVGVHGGLAAGLLGRRATTPPRSPRQPARTPRRRGR